jgi:hypothetical protein
MNNSFNKYSILLIITFSCKKAKEAEENNNDGGSFFESFRYGL